MRICPERERSSILEKVVSVADPFCFMQLVSLDVVSYSKRKSSSQVRIIQCFVEDVEGALADLHLDLHKYDIRKQDIDRDVIKIFLGDGVVVGFPFNNCLDMHLRFVKNFFKKMKKRTGKEMKKTTGNVAYRCNFEQDRWCNCHDCYSIRCGVSEGRLYIFKDLNDRFNMSGNELIDAVDITEMSKEDQILFSGNAYDTIVSWGDVYRSNFVKFDFRDLSSRNSNIKIDFGRVDTVFQYMDDGDTSIQCPRAIKCNLECDKCVFDQFKVKISNY